MTWLIGSVLGLLGIGGITAGAAYLLGPMVLLGMGRSAVKAVWGWLCHRSFWQLTTLAACAYIGVQFFELSHARHEAAKWKAQYIHVYTARLADRAAYVKAQAEAAALNKSHVAAIEAQQQRITTDVETRYQSDLARLRADGVRSPNAAPQHNPERPVAPAPSGPAGGPPAEVVSLPPAELLRAQEIELQLNALIDWTVQQSKLDPNKP